MEADRNSCLLFYGCKNKSWVRNVFT